MSQAYFVHPSACIDEGAVIGADTKIWHFCHIMSKTVIGERCNLGQNVFVAGHVKIGNGVKIQNNVSVYEGVTLEDDVFCGPSMVFTNDLNPRSAFPKGSANFVQTKVKQGCTIGANATVVCGVTLGAHAMIGAGAVVTQNVPDFALVYGVPAKLKGWACVCGEFLDFRDHAAYCSNCQRRYRQTKATQVELENAIEKGI